MKSFQVLDSFFLDQRVGKESWANTDVKVWSACRFGETRNDFGEPRGWRTKSETERWKYKEQ